MVLMQHILKNRQITSAECFFLCRTIVANHRGFGASQLKVQAVSMVYSVFIIIVRINAIKKHMDFVVLSNACVHFT